MDLLILGEPFDSRQGYSTIYRGVDRDTPSYCEECGAEDEINQLFRWYCDEWGIKGVVHCLEKARRFAQLWNERNPKLKYEIVERLEGNAPPISQGVFLGYDIVQGCYSLIGSSLIFDNSKNLGFNDFSVTPAGILSDLIKRFYKPQLNGQGLFHTYEVALLCLKAMDALQIFHPNLYEGCSLKEFRVVALYKLNEEVQPWAK